MAVIAISQQIGSRGIELGELAARELGYRFQTGEQLIAETAKRFNVSAEQVKWFDVHNPHFWERKTDGSRFAAYYRAVFLQEAAQDRIVVAGRGSSHFLPEGGCGIRVRTMAPVADRIKQVAKDEKLAPAAAEKRVRDFDTEVKARTHSLFGQDIEDPAIYDLVINTARLSLASHANTLAALATHIDSEGNPERTKCMQRRCDRGAGACGAGGASENRRHANVGQLLGGMRARERSRTGAAVGRTRDRSRANDRRRRIGRSRRRRRSRNLDYQLTAAGMRSLIIFFATGIYSGYSPIAPGTAGSVVGLVVVWLVFGPLWMHSPALCLMVFAIAFAIACWISDRAEKIFDNHDDSRIVIDEVLGMAATMFGNPITFGWLMLGFLLFRVADVIKPWPANLIDRRMRNGAGVMLDDLAAAIYANIVLQLIVRLL